ncbi:phosphatase PAP2 family protein [Sinomonas mesophila]|uniref:phosphatase PAP2 family protein n=1 Tax=Sinomonas mesophila TaxID=1531955 RepID=UPI001115ABD9|nr:phosphatase PAP2 family protein [Sinomonas mesophila]
MSYTTRAARILTEVFQPPAVISGLFLAAGFLGSGWDGMASGAVAALFMCILPWAAVIVLARIGRLTDHHVGEKKQRVPVLLATLGSTSVGVVLLLMMGAPLQVFAVLVAFVIGIVFMMSVSPFWKISGHATTLGGSAAIAVLLFGPAAFWVMALPPLVSWSRVRLQDHSSSQVLAGGVAGPLVIGAAFALTLALGPA